MMTALKRVGTVVLLLFVGATIGVLISQEVLTSAPIVHETGSTAQLEGNSLPGDEATSLEDRTSTVSMDRLTRIRMEKTPMRCARAVF